jgi:hypothetical protein
MEYSATDFMTAIAFIKAYREMEQRSLGANKKFIKTIIEAHQFKHLYESWAGRENDFGSYFLNLSHKNQGVFLLKFGIEVPSFQEYLTEIEIIPQAYAYANPPFIIMQLHELLKFFYNNGIHEKAVPGIEIYHLPENCYGNSTNWGNYILSLAMPDQLAILKQIPLNSLENIKADEENRNFIKRHIEKNGIEQGN